MGNRMQFCNFLKKKKKSTLFLIDYQPKSSQIPIGQAWPTDSIVYGLILETRPPLKPNAVPRPPSGLTCAQVPSSQVPRAPTA